MQGSFRKLFCLAVVLFAASSTRVHANATVYWDFDNGFSPNTVVIAPGDKVTWVNFDVYGFDVQLTVTGYSPITLSPGEGVYAIFNTPGTYSMNSDWGHHGSVIVELPVSVTITNPVNNAVLSAPATFPIETSVSENVAYMSFWLDSGNGPELLDYDYEAPFAYGLTNFAAGTYMITATGYTGYSEGSDSILITVTDVSAVITLDNPRRSGTDFLFDVNGFTVGKTLVLQDSANCITWNSIITNVTTAATTTFTNFIGTGGRFFRVLQLSPP